MTTRVTQVITDARAERCFDASDRTSASVSRALASIRSVILPPSQVARRVSSIAPVRSSTISSPLPRAHRPMSGRDVILEDIAFHHGRSAVGKYSHATGPRNLVSGTLIGAYDLFGAWPVMMYPVPNVTW